MACNDAMSQLQFICNERDELSTRVEDIAEKLKTSEQRVSEQLDLNQTLGSQTTNELND
jgi:hypothetical protein